MCVYQTWFTVYKAQPRSPPPQNENIKEKSGICVACQDSVQPGSEVIQNFMLNSAEHEILLANE